MTWSVEVQKAIFCWCVYHNIMQQEVFVRVKVPQSIVSGVKGLKVVRHARVKSLKFVYTTWIEFHLQVCMVGTQ